MKPNDQPVDDLTARRVAGLIERSSFGTPDACALRARVPEHAVRRTLEQVDQAAHTPASTGFSGAPVVESAADQVVAATEATQEHPPAPAPKPGSSAAGGCDEVRRHLWPYLDNETDLPTCAELEAHLEDCAHCRRMVEFDQRFKRLVRRCVDAEAVPASTVEQLRDRAARLIGTRSLPHPSKG
jgi:anti-sigma factor (TIGR02949 family)